MNSFASRNSHRLICELLWRDHSLSEQPGSQTIAPSKPFELTELFALVFSAYRFGDEPEMVRCPESPPSVRSLSNTQECSAATRASRGMKSICGASMPNSGLRSE